MTFSPGIIVKGTRASFQSCPTAMPAQAMAANTAIKTQAVISIFFMKKYYSIFRSEDALANVSETC